MGIKLMIFCLLLCINLVLFLLKDIFPGVVAVVHLMWLVVTYLIGTKVLPVGWVFRMQIWLVALIPKCHKLFWLCRDIHHHGLVLDLHHCLFSWFYAALLKFETVQTARLTCEPKVWSSTMVGISHLQISQGGGQISTNDLGSSFVSQQSFDINWIFNIEIYSNSLEY